MNYELIKIRISQKNLTIEEFCDKINITASGFHYQIKNNTMKIETLEKIANELNVPINYFFDKENTTYTIDAELLAIIKKLTNFDYAMFYGFLKGYGVLAANNGLQQNITPDLLQKLNYDLFVKYKTLVVPEIELLYKKGLICPEFYELLLMLHKR